LHGTRYYKPVDGDSSFFSLPKKDIPEGDIRAAHAVGVICKSTGHATKKKSMAVGALSMAAARAGLARVSGVDQYQVDTLGGELISRVELGLSVRPAVNCRAERLAFLFASTTDASQIFHHYHSRANVIRPGRQSFRGDMQHLLRYGFFPTTQALQKSSGGAGANTSYLGTNISDTSATVVESSTFDDKRFAIDDINSRKDVFDTRINTNDRADHLWLRNFNPNGKNQVPNPFNFFEF